MALLRSVLLIDDNPSDNLIHTIWLQRTGMVAERADVIVKEDGQQALEYLQGLLAVDAALPPLILLDINMPVMSGFELLEALQKQSRPHLDSVVVLMLTSSSAAQDRQQAAGCPLVKGYIEKPLTGNLIEEIRRLHFS